MFADSVTNFLQVNNLDGFDIDYESIPADMTAGDFAGICGQLKATFNNQYLLSITPDYWDNPDAINGAVTNFDLINSQSYWEDWDSDYYSRWSGLNVPDDHLTCGMSFEGGWTTYQDIVNYWIGNKNLGGVFLWSMADTSSVYNAINYMYDNAHY